MQGKARSICAQARWGLSERGMRDGEMVPTCAEKMRWIFVLPN